MTDDRVEVRWYNVKNKKRSEISTLEKINAFGHKHPNFRKYMDIIGDFIDKLMILYLIMVILIVAIPVLILYYNLPSEIRREVSGLFGGILSLIVIPFALNHINKRKENSFKLFEDNKPIYNILSDILISLLTTEDDEFKMHRDILNKFICENYSIMCISFPTSLIWDIVCIYKECEQENNNDNIKYYIRKCLLEIRNQEGLKKDFNINNSVIKMMASNLKKENYITKD